MSQTSAPIYTEAGTEGVDRHGGMGEIVSVDADVDASGRHGFAYGGSLQAGWEA